MGINQLTNGRSRIASFLSLTVYERKRGEGYSREKSAELKSVRFCLSLISQLLLCSSHTHTRPSVVFYERVAECCAAPLCLWNGLVSPIFPRLCQGRVLSFPIGQLATAQRPGLGEISFPNSFVSRRLSNFATGSRILTIYFGEEEEEGRRGDSPCLLFHFLTTWALDFWLFFSLSFALFLLLYSVIIGHFLSRPSRLLSLCPIRSLTWFQVLTPDL